MRRALLGLALMLALVMGGLVLGAGAILNTSTVRERVVAALSRATGHEVVLGGPIGLAWGTVPKVSVRNIMVLNRPGYSRTAFALARRVAVRVALWPLLRGRVEVRSVLVERPDVLLERNGQGVGNWEVPGARGQPPTGTPVVAERPPPVGAIEVVDGRVAYLNAPAVTIRKLSGIPAGGPFAGTAMVNGMPLVVSGATDAPAGDATRFVVKVAGGGATLSATRGADGVVRLEGAAANLATLGPLLGRALPSVAGVALTGEVSGGAVRLKVVTGGAALGSATPSLRLVASETNVTGLDQPLRVLAQVALNRLAVSAAVTAGPRGPGGGIPVAAVLTADEATVNVVGDVDGVAGTLTGTVSARVPDLRRTGLLAGAGLPALHDVALDVRVQPAGGGMALRGLRVTSAEGDVAGDLAVGLSPRPFARGSLLSQHVDLDAWTAVPEVPVVAPEAVAPTSTGPGAVPAPVPAAAQRIIPDTPLPLAALSRIDLDVRWTAAEALLHKVSYRALHMRVLLQDARLRVDPATVTAPGGPLSGVLEVDARAEPPTMALTLRGAGLDAGAAGDMMTGTVDLDVGLQARGGTLHALAETVTGHAAATLTGGTVENAALLALAGPVLRTADAGLDPGGRSAVRCLVVRADAAGGQVTLPTLVLEASRLRLGGDGRLDLGQETIDVHARPEVRVGPVPVQVPVHLTGSWRAPTATVDKGVIAPGRFGISIGGSSGADLCGPALASVRQGMTAIR